MFFFSFLVYSRSLFSMLDGSSPVASVTAIVMGTGEGNAYLNSEC